MTWTLFPIGDRPLSLKPSSGPAGRRVRSRFTAHSLAHPLFTILPVLLLAAPATEARATETAWKLYEPGQAPTEARFVGGPHQIHCGGYGVFEMQFDAEISERGEASPAPALEEGREVPPDFPLLAGSTPPGVFPSLHGRGAGAPFRSRVGEPPPPPCDQGSCFSAPGEGPWVAVVDWDNWHGWSVGRTVLQSSGEKVRAALFPLEDLDLTTWFGPRITDVHLLSELCRLAEVLELPAVEPPVAINLSFGRPRSFADAEDGDCDTSTLSCQILRVLDHLRTRSMELAPNRANPPLISAAAGNHGNLLFPASLPNVVSVGALDLQKFHRYGWAAGSWETPRETEALFPGYGLCLEYSVKGVNAAWPAPPGSSYSAALMTGWLAPSLETRRLPEGGGRWAPARFCWRNRCSYVAARGHRGYDKASAGLQDLIEGTGTDVETSCSRSDSDPETSLVRPLGWPTSVRSLPSRSFPEVTPALLRPSPEPASCVPCEERASRGRRRSQQTVHGADEDLGVAAGGSHLKSSPNLAVSLWAGQAIDPDLVISEVHLQVSGLLFPVKLSRSDLRQLEGGEVDLLEIDLGGFQLPKHSQPSLVWTLRGPSATSGEVEFWTSNPIVLRTR